MIILHKELYFMKSMSFLGNDIQQSDVFSELGLYTTTGGNSGGGGPIFGGPLILPMPVAQLAAVDNQEIAADPEPAVGTAEEPTVGTTEEPTVGATEEPAEPAEVPVEGAFLRPWWPGGGGGGSRQNFNVSLHPLIQFFVV